MTTKTFNFLQRVKNLRNEMSKKNIFVSLVWDPDNQYYLSGFRAISYTRPILLFVYEDKLEYIIPALEELHAKEKSLADIHHVYYEQNNYIGKQVTYHHHFQEIIQSWPKNVKVGLEKSIVPASVYDDLLKIGAEVVSIDKDIINLRAIKDENEMKWLEEAGWLSDVAITESLKNVKAGISELEFDAIGDYKLLNVAAEKYPNTIVGYENWTCSGIERSVMPHLYSGTRKFQNGDVVIHSRQVWVNGYRAENERTFFIGTPTNEQRYLFDLAIEAQRVGIEMIKPGVLAKDVDIASFEVFAKAGYGDYVNHRIGHGLGLSEHEEPYLRFDNDLILQEGMVYTIEPGVYVPGIGGFRHSDTVILTKNGCKTITNYPRLADDLIFS
jgi:Xaa-Pro dipeptidase